jgi:UDP-N-acetylmuramoylalanine--D-glutamate ligase
VTGSNGKSSVVKWCAEALKAQGRHPVIAGNYGPAFSEAVRIKREADPWVIEVSSFQLEWIEDFRPDVGVFLNLLPNHLDRHGSLKEYLCTKARIFENAKETDICICHHDWLEQVQAAVGRRGLWWSFDGCPQSDYMFSQGRILHHGGVIAHLEGTYFDNEVLGPAAGAAVAALRPFGVSPEQAAAALKTFEPLPHRMQKIADIDDVVYIDDSKATNLAGMMGGLRMAGRPVRLIAGGLPKEDDFGAAKEVLVQRARSVYLIGTASNSMASAWSGVVPVTACNTLENAVRRARQDAAPGDAILLSPGCASFDQFRDYEQRGEVFAEIVNRLAEEEVR